jgi:hypothetical protein
MFFVYVDLFPEVDRCLSQVKLRLCPDCGIKLSYKKYQRDEAERKNEEKLAKKRAKKEAKHARHVTRT